MRDATETDLDLESLTLGNDLGVALPSDIETAAAASLCGTATTVAATADRGVAAWLTDACSLASDSAEGMRSSCGLPSGTWIVRISGVSSGVIAPESMSMLMGDRGVDGADSDDALELAASVSSRTAEGIVVVALGGGSWVVAPASLPEVPQRDHSAADDTATHLT